ncbi:hypothetical protein [Allomesorhizobium alhagi]|uniref:Transmembrane protein n=1 Tax=Mesorhizobium alhagi CCNWXJ12-2 TaxID=1107882 RepID=H0HQR9_9HYPH|nr:hypothetical protein [Mesorhizobium alhagi]EHK56883.1 hypothetical protein MAXJ12_12497 [Mesorhizobium alhagi CCNWXJ12-2]
MDAVNTSIFGTPFFEISTVIFAVAAVTVWLTLVSNRAVRRTAELQAAEKALAAHYDAADKVLDDPALPEEARDAMVALVEFVADRKLSERFVVDFMDHDQRSSKAAPWASEMEKLRFTRSDLVENYHKAMMSGLIAMFLRWPSNTKHFYRFSAELAADNRRDAQIAERIAMLKKSIFGERNGSGTSMAAHC